MGSRITALLVLVAASCILPSCSSDQPQDPNKVSSIPWNRPEKWEGQGAMGGFTPQGTGGPGGSY